MLSIRHPKILGIFVVHLFNAMGWQGIWHPIRPLEVYFWHQILKSWLKPWYGCELAHTKKINALNIVPSFFEFLQFTRKKVNTNLVYLQGHIEDLLEIWTWIYGILDTILLLKIIWQCCNESPIARVSSRVEYWSTYSSVKSSRVESSHPLLLSWVESISHVAQWCRVNRVMLRNGAV